MTARHLGPDAFPALLAEMAARIERLERVVATTGADTSIRRFPSDAARDAAVPVPVAGQHVAMVLGTAAEGLYGRTSAGRWQRPWNMPWGHVYSHVRIANSTPGVGAPDAHTFTVVANRRYKLTISGTLTSTLSTFVQVGFSDVAANPFRTTWVRVEIGGASVTFSGSYVETFAPGPLTLQSYVAAIAGNASFTSNVMVPVQVIIEDIGPSGAPA